MFDPGGVAASCETHPVDHLYPTVAHIYLRANALNAQSQSLGARLASYNARASTPTSSPTVYRALVAQKQQLAAEVTRYNAAATNLARQSPAPPSRVTIRR
jgi:hypothetical protein